MSTTPASPANIPPPLLSHIHLLSKHALPSHPSSALLPLETITSHLLSAPSIFASTPSRWSFLDCPPIGSMFFAWQPESQLGGAFASDGYIWADAEQGFTSDVQGLRLEMLMQQAGWSPRIAAQYAQTHGAHAQGGRGMVADVCRKRYRLLPPLSGGQSQGDSSLWLVHYTRTERQNQIPIASVQMLPHVQGMFQARRLIQQSGALPRKDFMLNDKTTWPVITLPPQLAQIAARAGAGSGPMTRGHTRNGSIMTTAGDMTVEEAEDVSRGDLLDFMTPREMSRIRYEQHHEWMEEVLESCVPTGSIKPVDLGLGRVGPLSEFTDGFFLAPVGVGPDVQLETSGDVKMDGQGEKQERSEKDRHAEFVAHANKKLEEMQDDLEKIKRVHLKRMQKVKKMREVANQQVQKMGVQDLQRNKNVVLVARGGLMDIKVGHAQQQQGFPEGQAHLGLQGSQGIGQQQMRGQVVQGQQHQIAQQVLPKQGQSQGTGNGMAQQQNTSQGATAPMASQVNSAVQQGQAGQPTGIQAGSAQQPNTTQAVSTSGGVANNDLDPNQDDNVDANSNGDEADWDMLNQDEMDGGTTEDRISPDDNDQNLDQEQEGEDNRNDQRQAGDSFDMVPDFDMDDGEGEGGNDNRMDGMDTAGDALADYTNQDDDQGNDQDDGEMDQMNEIGQDLGDIENLGEDVGNDQRQAQDNMEFGADIGNDIGNEDEGNSEHLDLNFDDSAFGEAFHSHEQGHE